MSKLPGATIGCGERPADQTKLRGREPSLSPERYIYRGQDSWSRHQRSCNMAKVVEKSWESQTTNTKRWRKRKNQARSRSRGASKVLKIYKKVKRSFHMSSRKKYSPKVITTSRRKKRARRANKFQPLP
uniref:Uncharacterized protein n=1 Tax=Neovison vison TaxID=452646 RepID=A0A8C6ZWT2_NEOVI